MRPRIWADVAPLMLASRSESRRALLVAAGLEVEVHPAEIDERAFERQFFEEGGAPRDLALALAQAKALAISGLKPDAYCLGADQTLILEGQLIHKPRDLAEAAQTLTALAGRKHSLISAYAVARSGMTLIVDDAEAELTMRVLDRETIRKYLNLAGQSALSSVGGYQLEGLGVHLFEGIEGDHFTVLGMPMLRLLSWLRLQRLVIL